MMATHGGTYKIQCLTILDVEHLLIFLADETTVLRVSCSTGHIDFYVFKTGSLEWWMNEDATNDHVSPAPVSTRVSQVLKRLLTTLLCSSLTDGL